MLATIVPDSLRTAKRPIYSWDGELKFQSEHKQAQREAVLAHLLKYSSPLFRFQLLAFPGPEWTFEKMVLAERPDAYLRCLEREWGILEYGVRHMPGERKRREVYQFPVGAMHGFSSVTAKIVHIDFLDMSRGSARKLSTVDQRTYYSQWKRNSAVWLDGQSPVGGLLTGSLSRVGHFCEKNVAVVPFAYTFLIGRDEAGTFEQRVNALCGVLNGSRFRTFEPTDAFQYHGEASSMGTLLGTLTIRNKDALLRKRTL